MPKRTADRAPTASFIAQSGRRPTSYDVARIAGVSQSAVSRCFAPNASIAPAKRELILKVASELGYRPNALAQALISKRTNLVAVLISNLTNLYYPEVLAGLSASLTKRDVRVLLFSLGAESEVDDVIDQIWRHSVDGVIAAARLSEQQLEQFADHQIPVVMYNRLASGPNAASVRCDSVGGERDLVERLIASGHRHFGIIAGPEDSYVGEERNSAARTLLAERGFGDVPMVRGDFSYASGRAGVRELARIMPKLDAVVCASDLMAIGAMDEARIELGRDVPKDLSIVGFDGSGPATWESYRLTTIRQPVGRMTAAAAAMLMERIEDPASPAEQRLFSGQMIEGASARLGA
ncbi:DNA-binding transcriptional regulator, LacI/PurR family [Sphingomonas sp. NFR04]|uniref:LacI family DNA-binding transcriptional regulator n=1 Tax=Sphingomonas sp. NFR04 TaxID=1566283 RepID=UPI0008F05D8F|nr:LacI family DNA-binding transcriptional regulator [Sphingomonas sp. NFR04]SFK06762.1 DNA-binding transcriptional regulator, LacI/PurR family [Sphingomonas sp. NFR04]